MRLLAYVVLTAWIMFGLMMFCHRQDLQEIRQVMHDRQDQRYSQLEEVR